MRKGTVFAMDALGFLLQFMISATIFIVVALVAGSLLTSGIKVTQDDCGKYYKIERFVHGELFCEDK